MMNPTDPGTRRAMEITAGLALAMQDAGVNLDHLPHLAPALVRRLDVEWPEQPVLFDGPVEGDPPVEPDRPTSHRRG